MIGDVQLLNLNWFTEFNNKPERWKRSTTCISGGTGWKEEASYTNQMNWPSAELQKTECRCRIHNETQAQKSVRLSCLPIKPENVSYLQQSWRKVDMVPYNPSLPSAI